MKSLFRSKNRCNSPSYAHSSRSSSLTSTGDSGIDDDINQTGSSSSTMSNYSNQVDGGARNFFTPPNVSVNNGTSAVRSNFHVEHLASFPLSAGDKMVSAKERLQKAKELITKGEPWTKEMELSITEKEIILRDFQTQEMIERYPSSHVDSVQEVNDDPMLKSVLVFSTVQTAEKYAAVHLFQCDKVPAHVIAPEINKMIAKNPRVIPRSNSQTNGVSVLPPPPSAPAPSPPKAVIGAKKTETPVVGPNHTATKTIQGESYSGNMSLNLMGAQINREVHILNHCIDDIEELVYRVKQVAEAWKQLEIKYKSKKSKSRKQEAEGIESRSPPREEFIDAFQKCKYSFILLGKLREHLKNPSSAELLHHLMNPLSLLIRCTRGPEEASKVINPLMTSESIELLRSTLNDKETELWQSLGPAWTLPKSSPQWNNRSLAPYEPKFRSGWVPPEIIGSGRSMPANVGAAVAASAAERGDKLKNNANKEVTVTGKKSTFKKATAVFSFNGSNSKELSVVKGDELLILDDSRQWWCVRNSRGDVGFVPYTVFTPSGSLNRNEVKAPSESENTNSSNGVSNDASTFENMIQNRATTLKKVEDIEDGKVANKRLSNADMLTSELRDKISAKAALTPTANRPNTQESTIILRKGSSASDVQQWMKSKKFSEEAMGVVKNMNAEQLGDLSKTEMSHLVGVTEGKKLFSQLTVEKAGDSWHQIVVHRGVSELEAVMNRRKNISESVPEENSSQAIKSAVRAAQTDRHDTWIEKKITRRTSLDKFQDVNNARIKTHEKLSKQNSNEARNPTTTVPITSSKIIPTPTATKPPAPALKPRRSSASAFQPIPPPPPDYKEESQTAVVNENQSNDQKVSDLLREHEKQQQLLMEQQKELVELRTQQQQKEQIQSYEQDRIRLEQQVKDQEAYLAHLKQQQQQLQLQQQGLQPNQLQQSSPISFQTATGLPPQGGYISYIPYHMSPNIQGVQGIPQPIYTLPYGAIPPPMTYPPK